jgi:Asp-tRNA(Asn)/Glu-tRNA(Gln) amidotransferase A subunit family amidase
MGAQIVGRSRADALVLRAGRTIERALPMPAVAGHT